MGYQRSVAALTLLAVLFSACRKEEDDVPPTITLVRPSDGFAFTVPDTLEVELDAYSEGQLDRVLISLVNEQGVPMVPVMSVTPTGNPAHIEVPLPVTSEALASGVYRLVAEARSGVASARDEAALQITAVAEPFIRARALRHMEKGRVIVLAAGTGNPFFTTDTCASLRAVELQAQVLLKATKVDGIYTADPRKDPKATRYETLKFGEVLEKRLAVMDLTAMTMCMEHRLPVEVFNFRVTGNVKRAVLGERVGTLVTAG